MEFTSIVFIILFSLTILLYFFVPQKLKKLILLASSAIFIGYANVAFFIAAFLISFMCFYLGKLIEKTVNERKRSRIFIAGISAHISILLLFKYAGFFETNILSVFNFIGYDWDPVLKGIILPLGISFYSFQAISYLVDIYWEEQEAENNLLDFLIYMLFIMKFLSGPIERANDFLPQLKKKISFNYDNAVYGLHLIASGLFKKLIIADRISPNINMVFDNISDYSMIQLVIATLLYPIYLYADFSGYTDIAIGGASILGIKLSPNFNRPFSAKTITDFWRRWHMSLSFWVKDYIYEPIAASKRYWGKWGIIFSLFMSFTILGFWHGSNWNFIIYGAIQGLIISYEMLFTNSRNKFKNLIGSNVYNVYSIIRTYLLFSFSLLFFRIESFSEIKTFFQNLLVLKFDTIKDFTLELKDHDIIVFIVAVIFLFTIEKINSGNNVYGLLRNKSHKFRWLIYYITLLVFILFSSLNNESFIYIQF